MRNTPARATPDRQELRITVQPNPQYEAGFIRSVDHADPEDLLMEQERQARLKKVALIALAAVAACIAGGVYVARGGDSAAKQLEKGKLLSGAHQHQSAIVEFKLSLLGDPDQPAVRFLLGQEYAALGDPKSAEIELRKALDGRYDPEQTLPLLVASLVRQEQFEKVVTMVKGATVQSPATRADLQALLGSAYFALGKDPEAHDAWRTATRLVPSHPGALLAEARALVTNGDFEQAGALLDRLPSTAWKQNDVQVVRGDIARATGKLDEAATAYEAAVAFDPGNLPNRASLAQIDVDLGRFDDAKRQVDAILLASPDHPKARYLGALAAVGRGDFRAAYETIALVVQQAPRDGKAQRLAGTIAIALAHPEEAELHLREAVALMPRDAEARRALADFYVGKHDPARADETIAPLVAATPGDPRVADVVARIALLQGDAARASRAYDLVDPTRPANAGTSLRAASLKFAAGDNAGGLARLRAAASAGPDDADVDAALIAAYVHLRQPKDALAAWNALARKRPDAARTYDVLSTIDLATGDRAAARRSLEKAAGLDPHDFTAVEGLAKLDLDVHRADEAANRLRQFIAAHPGHVDATMQLVQIEKANGDREAAIVTLLNDARKADPRSSRVVQALATHYLEHGDSQQALRCVDEALALMPGDASLLEIAGNASLASGNPARATKIYKALTASNAESADYPLRLGTAWLAAGDPEAGLAAFRLAIARQPDRTELQRATIGTLLADGKADEASRLLFEINRTAPNSKALPELDGDVKLARKQYPEALAAYRRAFDATPTSPLLIRTADALAKARQPADASALVASWLKTHPADEAVRSFDADLALRARDFGRASDDFRTLLRLRPNDPELLRKLTASDAQAAGSVPAPIAAPALRNTSISER